LAAGHHDAANSTPHVSADLEASGRFKPVSIEIDDGAGAGVAFAAGPAAGNPGAASATTVAAPTASAASRAASSDGALRVSTVPAVSLTGSSRSPSRSLETTTTFPPSTHATPKALGSRATLDGTAMRSLASARHERAAERWIDAAHIGHFVVSSAPALQAPVEPAAIRPPSPGSASPASPIAFQPVQQMAPQRVSSLSPRIAHVTHVATTPPVPYPPNAYRTTGHMTSQGVVLSSSRPMSPRRSLSPPRRGLADGRMAWASVSQTSQYAMPFLQPQAAPHTGPVINSYGGQRVVHISSPLAVHGATLVSWASIASEALSPVRRRAASPERAAVPAQRPSSPPRSASPPIGFGMPLVQVAAPCQLSS